jgi:glyoxylase-like metal-dependent hydrolase (beta-lactamase superfamily II)
MKKALKIIGLVVLVLVLLLAGAAYALFGGLQGGSAGPALGAGVQAVPGFSTVYLLDAGNGQYVLIDTGQDAKGTAILAALNARHATPDSVAAIFITHSHADHIAAIPIFPKATVYAMKREVPLAAGQEPFGGPLFGTIGLKNSTPFTVGHPLDDGEKVMIGNLEITAFAVPGHTEGSGAYLADGVLFTGDAIQVTSSGKLIGPSRLFSTNHDEGVASLKHLSQQLGSHPEAIVIATAHTGTAPVSALTAFAAGN